MLRNCCKCKWFWSFQKNGKIELTELPKNTNDVTDFEDKINQPEILIIREIDACSEKNGPLHHTERYHHNQLNVGNLVVRRGQLFQLKLKLNRPFNDTKDGISFIFTLNGVEKPNHGNGTLIGVPLMKRPNRTLNWNAILVGLDDDTILVNVVTSANSCLGQWHLEIDTRIINGGSYTYAWEKFIFILANPWLKSDQVYLKSEQLRQEIVSNDIGIIYRGTFNQIKPVLWKYDQFEENVLDSVCFLLEKINASERANIVAISRSLTASVNAADDDNGVVLGNWSGDFRGGIAPSKWLGSKLILQEYWKTKKPVKFGQCWVYAGVLTTVCRTLGIPARTITNYCSAHDTQNSLTLDYFMDSDGKILEKLNSDSIWNFHCWNEIWTSRPDLGNIYSGWQVIDATPQERSDSLFRCGPAPVHAIKEGEILRHYDTNFVFSEVNADKIFWKWNGPKKPLKLLRKDTTSIGKLIITKSSSSSSSNNNELINDDYDDLTSSYKYLEKTNEERSVMLKALRQSENLFSRYYLNEEFNDVIFDLRLMDDTIYGETFKVSVEMKNRSKTKNYRVKIILRIDAIVNYTGKLGSNIKNDTFDVNIKPETDAHEVQLSVTYDQYSAHLKSKEWGKVEEGIFKVSCLANVEETNYEYFAEDDFRIRLPNIEIKLLGEPHQLQEITVKLTLRNPLPVALKNGKFIVEAPGISEKRLKVPEIIPPGEEAMVEIKFIPTQKGRHVIIAKFSSKQLYDIDGYLIFQVDS